MKVILVGKQLVITSPDGYTVGQEFDVTALHAREKVTATNVMVTDLANPQYKWGCILADFEGDTGPITDEASIKTYLRNIVG
jgi:hypothetical protein